jgi:hypothetical protein
MIQVNLKSASEIYLDLISQAEDERARALAEYEDYLNQYCAARMVEFAAEEDAKQILLEQERELLREGELSRLRDRVEFWHLRLEKLKACNIGEFRRCLEEDNQRQISLPQADPVQEEQAWTYDNGQGTYRQASIA